MMKAIHVVILIAALGATGCRTISSHDYAGFAHTMDEIVSDAKATDDRIHIIHLRYRVATAPDDPLTTDSFQIVSGETDAALSESLEIRSAALEVLRAYSSMVDVMASGARFREVSQSVAMLEPSVVYLHQVTGLAEGTEGLTAATTNLARTPEVRERTVARDALVGITFLTKHTASVALGSTSSRVLATAIGSAAGYQLNRKRREQLLAIMEQSQPDIAKISSIVESSNNAIKAATRVMVESIVAHANSVRPRRDDPARIAFDADIAGLLEDKNTIMTNLDSLATAMKLFPTAHTELIASLQNKPTNRQALHTLVREAKRMETDFRSLK